MKFYRLICAAVILTFLVTLIPTSAFAYEEEPLGPGQQPGSPASGSTDTQEGQNSQEKDTAQESGGEQGVIAEIRELPETIKKQTITVRPGRKQSCRRLYP